MFGSSGATTNSDQCFAEGTTASSRAMRAAYACLRATLNGPEIRYIAERGGRHSRGEEEEEEEEEEECPSVSTNDHPSGWVSVCWVSFVKSHCGEVEVSLGLCGGVLGGDEVGGRALWLS